MRKKVILMIMVTITMISCNTMKNYNMVNEMNGLYPIEMVYYDDKTTAQLGEFPPSRELYVELIKEIEKQNPKYIILKFLFDSEKPEDNVLYEELKKYNNVLTEATTTIESDEGVDISSYSLKDLDIDLKNHDNILLPNKTLREGFSGIGLADFTLKNDEYMDFPVVTKVNNQIIPSIAILIAKDIAEHKVEYKEERLYFNNKYIEISNGNYRIDLSEPEELYQSYSIVDILNEDIKHNFKDKIVIVFVEAPYVRTVKSDYGKLHNKAEIVADSINSILKELE